MFEHRTKPLLPPRDFLRRMLLVSAVVLVLVLVSLLIGAAGYRGFEGMSWTDAVLNAAMISTGMGPVSELHTDGGKWFAIGYALFSGFLLLSVAALILAPIAHRILHRFHLELDEEEPPRGAQA